MSGKPFSEKQYTATSKRTGERCAAWRMKGKDVGYHHGGKSPIGAGSATFKDGRHSKYRAIFSGDALEHYEAASQDPRYVKLREQIALFNAPIIEELERAKIGKGAALWRQLEGDGERKRLTDEQRMITEAQAIAFASTVIAIVSSHVPERKRCAAIGADIARLIQQDVSPGKRIVSAP